MMPRFTVSENTRQKYNNTTTLSNFGLIDNFGEIIFQLSLLTFSHFAQVFPVGAHFCFFLPSNSSNACSEGSTTRDAH